MTGATSGLGQATATELAWRGGNAHFLVRDQGRAARTRRQIIAETGNGSASNGMADLADLDSVIEFARDFAAGHDRLDVLIHNAGAMYDRYQVSDAGLELTFGAQVAGPFAVTMLLPQVLAAAPSRVIGVSSGGMYSQPLARSATPMSPGNLRRVTAYARAKRAQVALSAEWARPYPLPTSPFMPCIRAGPTRQA